MKKEKHNTQESELNRFLLEFIVYCPSAYKKQDKKEKTARYEPVSKKNCSFRERKIRNDLLTKVINKIKDCVCCIEMTYCEQVETAYLSETKSNNDFEKSVIVYKKHSEMSRTESIYYYIRNAFAHGDFEKDGDYYYLESSKGTNYYAKMKLSVSTLNKLIEIKNLSAEELHSVAKNKNKRKKKSFICMR